MTSNLSQEQSLLLFSLDHLQKFAINVLKVKEIIVYSSLSHIPNSHKSVIGVTELRGESLPVIDISIAMGLGYVDLDIDHNKEMLPSIIMTELNGKTQGILVKQVSSIKTVNSSDIKPLPKSSGTSHYATGVVEIDDKLVTLIDVEKILSETYDLVTDNNSVQLDNNQLAEINDKSVLVVDDSSIARHHTSETLHAIGLKLTLASDAIEALALLETPTAHYDMIISDIEMPILDGYNFSRQVRALNNRHENTYILLHTSLPVSEENMDYKCSQANAILTKQSSNLLVKHVYQGLTHANNIHRSIE